MAPQASGLPPGPSRPVPRRKPAPARRTTGRRLRTFAIRAVLVGGAISLILAGVVYVSFSRLIDDRLYGERETSLPRVYARPFTIRKGQSFSQQDLIARLNDIGYAQRGDVSEPGEFSIRANEIALTPRSGPNQGKRVRVVFRTPPKTAKTAKSAPPPTRRGIEDIEIANEGRATEVELDRPVLTALMTSGARQKRRKTPLASIPEHMQQAVLAIEDRSFYSHPGINPLRLAAVALRSAFGSEAPGGTSTVTQQLSRMFFLADEFNAELQSGDRGKTWGSYMRKARESLMSLVLERKASKQEILELYLNDVYLGQRGSFAIHGVAEATRIFFGKDVANISLSEAAVIAGVIQSPASRSPFGNPKRSVERRNVVLRAMAEEGFVPEADAEKAMREPLVVARASLRAADAQICPRR